MDRSIIKLNQAKWLNFLHILRNIEIVQINIACLHSTSDNGQPFLKWQI